MRLNVIVFLLLFMPIALSAQVRKVSGTYTYYGDANMSVKEVRAAAIEGVSK